MFTFINRTSKLKQLRRPAVFICEAMQMRSAIYLFKYSTLARIGLFPMEVAEKEFKRLMVIGQVMEKPYRYFMVREIEYNGPDGNTKFMYRLYQRKRHNKTLCISSEELVTSTIVLERKDLENYAGKVLCRVLIPYLRYLRRKKSIHFILRLDHYLKNKP